MPKLPTGVTYHHKTGILQIRWYETGPDGMRRQRQKSCPGMNAKQASEERARIIMESKNGTSIMSKKLYVIDFWYQWIDWRYEKKKITYTTLIRYKQYVKNNIAPLAGNTLLQDVRPVQIEIWMGDLLESGGVNGDGLSTKTVHGIYGMIHASFNQAVKWRLLSSNPAKYVDPPSIEKTERKITDMAGISRLLEIIKRSKYRIPVLIAVSTGMRRAEIAGLKWEDLVEGKKSRFIIRRQLQFIDGQFQQHTLKTKKPRTARVPPTLADILKEHRKWQEERAEISPNEFHDDGWICTHPNGQPFAPDSITKAFWHLSKNAKLGGVTLHGLRHTLGTYLLNEGVSDSVTADMLGHDIRVLHEVYYHSVSDGQDPIVEISERMLNPNSKPQIRIVEGTSDNEKNDQANSL